MLERARQVRKKEERRSHPSTDAQMGDDPRDWKDPYDPKSFQGPLAFLSVPPTWLKAFYQGAVWAGVIGLWIYTYESALVTSPQTAQKSPLSGVQWVLPETPEPEPQTSAPDAPADSDEDPASTPSNAPSGYQDPVLVGSRIEIEAIPEAGMAGIVPKKRPLVASAKKKAFGGKAKGWRRSSPPLGFKNPWSAI